MIMMVPGCLPVEVFQAKADLEHISHLAWECPGMQQEDVAEEKDVRVTLLSLLSPQPRSNAVLVGQCFQDVKLLMLR